jgi:hypothetical protein
MIIDARIPTSRMMGVAVSARSGTVTVVERVREYLLQGDESERRSDREDARPMKSIRMAVMSCERKTLPSSRAFSIRLGVGSNCLVCPAVRLLVLELVGLLAHLRGGRGAL